MSKLPNTRSKACGRRGQFWRPAAAYSRATANRWRSLVPGEATGSSRIRGNLLIQISDRGGLGQSADGFAFVMQNQGTDALAGHVVNASRVGLVDKGQNARVLLQKTEDGKTFFSINGRDGRAFAANQGSYDSMPL